MNFCILGVSLIAFVSVSEEEHAGCFVEVHAGAGGTDLA